MVSIIITAKDEAPTIKKAVDGFLKQAINDDFELIVVAPDRKTLRAAQEVSDKVKIIQDAGRGKAEALNLALGQAQGKLLVFSDGDVAVKQDALAKLMAVEADLVSGRPVAYQDQESNMFAYWQRVLFDSAHQLRLERDKQKKFLLVSGYLFSVKSSVLNDFKFDENLLTEDEYLSYWVWHQGYKISYAGQVEVKVKCPDNYSDWLKQKVRTLAGGYQLPQEWKKNIAMRGFLRESFKIWWVWQRYVKNFKQACWMALLFIARLQAWLLAFTKVKLLKQNRAKIWQRVASTK